MQTEAHRYNKSESTARRERDDRREGKGELSVCVLFHEVHCHLDIDLPRHFKASPVNNNLQVVNGQPWVRLLACASKCFKKMLRH